jgi:hypothetical protein
MDLVGPLPETDEHNRYMLTMMDTFSKWPMAIPIPNKKASTIAMALYKNLIAVHGCPEEILSDQEHTLLAEAVSTLCAKFGIHRITSSAYSPWQNGSVERFHRFLGASLSIYASENKRDWDQWVDCILFTYRVSVHAKTGESPYRVIFNRDPRLAGDVIFQPVVPGDTQEDVCTNELVENLEKWFGEVRAKQKALATKDMDRANAVRRNKTVEFKNGDWILLFEPPVTHQTIKRPWSIPRKFQDCLTGPHKVVSGRQNSQGEVNIFHTRRGKKEMVHISRIVPYNPWSDDFPDTSEGCAIPGHGLRDQSRNGQVVGDVVQQVVESGDSEFKSGASEYRNGDNVQLGEMVIVSVIGDGSDDDPDSDTPPFILGKICELGEKKDAIVYDEDKNNSYRTMNVRVWGNTKNKPTQVYRPGWISKGKGKGRAYFRAKEEHHTHQPYLSNDMPGAALSTYNVILAGFELSSLDKLPIKVLEALERCEWIDWQRQ